MESPSTRKPRLDNDRGNDDRFNEAFQTILRDAAEIRENRQLALANEEAAAARKAWIDLLSLVRVSAGES